MVIWTGAFTIFESVRAIARAHNVFTQDSIANFGESLLRFAAIALASFVEPSLFAFAFAYASEAVVSAIVYGVWLRRRLDLRNQAFQARSSAQLLRSAMPIGMTMIAMSGFYRIDQVLVRLLADAQTAGMYAAASRVSLAANVVGILVGLAVLPDLSKCVPGSPLAARKLRQALILSTSLGAAAMLFNVVFSHDIIYTLFGSKYSDAVRLLRVLSPVVMLNAITVVANTAASAFHRERRVVRMAYLLAAQYHDESCLHSEVRWNRFRVHQFDWRSVYGCLHAFSSDRLACSPQRSRGQRGTS
jgi:O-antigen/teichoic acid export membrane protein